MTIRKALTLGALLAAGAASRAELPVEPATFPKLIEFKRALEPTDEAFDAKSLVMTTVQFDDVSVNVPAEHDQIVGLELDRAIEKLLRTAVNDIPRASVTMKATLAHSPKAAADAAGYTLAGGLSAKVLSRSGLAPARDVPPGSRVSHVAIDRLGFEIRWTPDFPVGTKTLHQDVVHVDSRQVGVVAGRSRSGLDLNLRPNLRARLVVALRQTLGTSAPDRFDPRVYVHLLDLNQNNFGAYALDQKLNEDLVREASR